MEADTISKNGRSSKSQMSRRNIYYACLLFLTIITLSSCATIFSGSRQQVSFNSDPPGAVVKVKGEAVGMTPMVANIKRASNRQVTFTREGFEPAQVQLKGNFNPTVLWNILWLPIPMFGVDYATGAAWRYNNHNVFVNLRPTAVTRDAPGATELDRTVIRWRFDTDPRGARISWRVISSVPEVVKNTNETYLSTTPFEETRAFDILGLTYENSNNVVIEIKVERRGYYEQVRRYNVRQALDQREISGFFELVPTN